MQRTSDSILICVRVDRCWNRYWRCLLLLGFLFLGIILFALLRSGNNSGPMLETNWQKHWSQTQDSAPGSKQVFQSAGSVVNIKNEFVDEYVAQEHDPEPDEGEYYDRDNPDVEQKDSEYMLQYHNDEMMGKQDQARPGSMGVVPEIHDYSLKEKFKQLFKSSPGEDIQFEENYVNPCWPETIPRLPYQNNSYLKVKEQSAVLEPQFQYMRQLFAKRSDPSNRWRLRCLPYFYIMETPPMATPRLYNALRFHPLIVNPDMAEPEFWNQRGPECTASLKDYLDIFDAASEKIRSNTSSVSKDGRMTLEHRQVTGDGTSSYLWAVDRWRNLLGNSGEPEPKTTVADIIKSLTPNSKIVMVLRNPTERLFQGYISQSENPSASDFHSKTGQALKSMTSCEQKRNIRSCVYDSFLNKRLPVRLRIGMYYPFIQDWINVFGKDQVKVIRYEDYVGNPSEVINDVCSFLQLPPYPTKDLESMEVMIKDMEKKRKANQKLKILSATRAMLKEFHRKLNEQLANLLQDDKFLWPELEVDSDLIKEQLAPTEAQQRELDERQQLQEKERLSREQQAIEQQKRDQQTQEQQTINQQATEQQARNQQAKEQQVREQQAREQQAREQQAREQQAREQQAREQQVREQQAREQQAREQQAREQQTREQQAREQQAREQQAKEQQAKEQQAKEQQAKEQQAKEQLAREQQVKEQQAREQQAKEQLAREQQVKEQQAREQQAREQQAREQQAREQQAKEQQIREQQAREQQAREQQAKEQQAREQQAREQQQFDQQKAQQNQINQQMQQDQRQVTEHQQSQLNQQQGQDQRIQYQAQQSQQQQQQQQQGQIIQHRAQ